MQNKKNIVYIAVLILLLGGVGFYIYTDTKKRGGTTQENISTTATSSDEPGYTITPIPVENPAVGVKAPALNRQVVFKGDISLEAKSILANNIARLTASLKGDTTRFGDWLELGIQYKIAGDYEGAKEAWEYASALSPNNYVSFSNLGDLYTNYLKNYPKAEENFKISIKNKSDYIGGYRALHELYRYSYKEKANLAPQILKEGLSKNPKSTDLMVLLAQYYKETGDKDTARTYYQKALTEAKAQGNTSLAVLLEQEIASL